MRNRRGSSSTLRTATAHAATSQMLQQRAVRSSGKEELSSQAYLAEVHHSLVDAQPQGQQRDAQAQLLCAALTLPRPHSLQLNLRASTNNPQPRRPFWHPLTLPRPHSLQLSLLALPTSPSTEKALCRPSLSAEEPW